MECLIFLIFETIECKCNIIRNCYFNKMRNVHGKICKIFNMKEAHFIKLEFLKYVMQPRFFEKYLYINIYILDYKQP